MGVTKEEIAQRLRQSNRAEVSRKTGLKYRYLRNIMNGDIGDPGSSRMDKLRAYFLSLDTQGKR